MHSGDTLLYDALNLLEHVGVFFIDPVSQVSAVIQDLTDEDKDRGKFLFLKSKGEKEAC